MYFVSHVVGCDTFDMAGYCNGLFRCYTAVLNPTQNIGLHTEFNSDNPLVLIQNNVSTNVYNICPSSTYHARHNQYTFVASYCKSNYLFIFNSPQ